MNINTLREQQKTTIDYYGVHSWSLTAKAIDPSEQPLQDKNRLMRFKKKTTAKITVDYHQNKPSQGRILSN